MALNLNGHYHYSVIALGYHLAYLSLHLVYIGLSAYIVFSLLSATFRHVFMYLATAHCAIL